MFPLTTRDLVQQHVSSGLLAVEAVKEFHVVSDTYSAAYGKRDGAQISIVTTSGTNRLHGDAYEFLRNSYFNVRNYLDQARIPEFQRNNYGAALGGPPRRNKLFLFGNYEGYRQNLGLSLDTLVPDNQARSGIVPNSEGVYTPTAVSPMSAQLLNLWPLQNGPEVLLNGLRTGIANAYGTTPQKIREDFGITRFDANPFRRPERAGAQGTVASQSTSPVAGTPGTITSTANTSRQIQLGLKLLF